jgi:hypothetical protein
MCQRFLYMSMIRRTWLAFLAFLISNAVFAASGPVWELRVTTAQVDGSCLHRDSWQNVKGRYHYWELIQINDVTNYSGKLGEDWKALRHHTYSFLVPSDAETNFGARNGDIYFNLEEIDESVLAVHRRLSQRTTELNQYEYVDVLRAELKKPNLLPATLVRYVRESELYRLNRLNSFNPFKDNTDGDGRKLLVPLDRSVCDLKISYLMKDARARYEKSFFGKRVLISNETVPLDKGQKTFAEEWLAAN